MLLTNPIPIPGMIVVYFRFVAACVLLASFMLPANVHGQNAKQTIEIPIPAGAKLDSQDPRSIDFVAPGGKGHTVVTAWLAQFKSTGWSVKVLDEDLPHDGEYELNKNGMTIEIEFDDPAIVPADIEISCGSKYVLQLAGTQSKSAKSGHTGKSPGAMSRENSQTADKVKLQSKEIRLGGRIIKETPLGSVAGVNFYPEDGQTRTWWASPNGRRFAFVVGSNLAINVDGQQYEFSPKDESFAFSPDSQHFAVASNRGGRLAIMIDGQSIETTNSKIELDDLSTPLIFSPDGQHVACIATDKSGAFHLLIDGVSRASWPRMILELAFTSDNQNVLCAFFKDADFLMYQQTVASNQAGKELGHTSAHSENIFFYGLGSRVGYVAKFSEEEVGVIYEGQEQGDRLLEIKRKNVRVSYDGSRVFYMGDCSPIRNTVVFNGKRGLEHNPFEDGRVVDEKFVVSRDNNRLAYVLEKDALQRVMVDGKLGPEYQEIASLEFSPDCGHFSYLAMKDGSPLLVIDGVEGQKHAMVSLPDFSNDGKRVAYYAELSGKQFCVVDGKKQAEHDGVEELTISPDGKAVAYIATNGNSDHVVVNGTPQQPFAIAMILGFYPGSSRLVYFGERAKKEYLIDDGKSSKPYDFVRGPACFSSDGKHLAVATILQKKQRILVDGAEDPVFDFIVDLGNRTVNFEATKYYYYAVRQEELYQIEADIP